MRALPPLHDADRLEHRVAEILTEQEIHGWTFNESKAQLEELKNKPNPKTLSSTPEGSFNERDVDYSSNLIERSLR